MDEHFDESRHSTASLRTVRYESADPKLKRFATLRNSSQRRRESNATCVTMGADQSTAGSEMQLFHTSCQLSTTTSSRLPLRSLASVYWKLPQRDTPQSSWFARFLARRAWAVIVFWILLALAALTVCVTTGHLPQFADPHVGFEAQNTETSARMITWKMVRSETASIPSSHGYVDANTIANTITNSSSSGEKRKRTRRSAGKLPTGANDKWTMQECVDVNFQQSSVIYRITLDPTALLNSSNMNVGTSGPKLASKLTQDASTAAATLLFNVVTRICLFESTVFDYSDAYASLCLPGDSDCCPRQSLPNAITRHARKTQCKYLTFDDINQFLREATRCANGNVKQKEGKKSADCMLVDMVQNLLIESDPAELNASLPLLLQRIPRELHVLTLLPVPIEAIDVSSASRAAGISLFEAFERASQTLNKMNNHAGTRTVVEPQIAGLSVVPIAIDLGSATKSDVFGKAVLRDSRLLAVSTLGLLVLLLAYGRLSVLLAAGALGSLALVYVLAYFTYTVVFGVQFFSVLNLLAIVVLLAIGTDNFFLIHHQFAALCASGRRHPASSNCVVQAEWAVIVDELYSRVTRHVLAINGTTLAGCALNVLIAVPVLRCFALFSSLLVVFHVLFALSWLPAVLLIHFRFLAPVSVSTGMRTEAGRRPSSAAKFCRILAARFDDIASLLESGALRYLVVLPIRYLRYALVFIFVATAAFAVYYVVAHSDRYLAPLTSNSTIAQLKTAARQVRLFADAHPLERYEKEIMRFASERSRRASEPSILPLGFVFGFVSHDPRGLFNPETRVRATKLIRDTRFDPLSVPTQHFLYNLCDQLRAFEYASNTMDKSFAFNDACFLHNALLTNCKPADNGSRWTDLQPDVFHRCLTEFQQSMVHFGAGSNYPSLLLSSKLDSGPRYARSHNTWNTSGIVGYLVYVATDLTLAHTVTELEKFRTVTDSWFETLKRQHVDVALEQAFFTSALAEYDLFRTLHDGLGYATLGMTGCVLLVTFVVTRNVLLTVLTALTVAVACACTGLLLTIAGWTLGVAESVCVSLLIGLSVDYALHCALTLADVIRCRDRYTTPIRSELLKTAGADKHAMLVQYASDELEQAELLSDTQLQDSLKPLLYAALSSLFVALPLLVSDVALYRQTSAFISILVTVSWCSATLFLTSCLKICDKLFVRSTLRC